MFGATCGYLCKVPTMTALLCRESVQEGGLRLMVPWPHGLTTADSLHGLAVLMVAVVFFGLLLQEIGK